MKFQYHYNFMSCQHGFEIHKYELTIKSNKGVYMLGFARKTPKEILQLKKRIQKALKGVNRTKAMKILFYDFGPR